MNPRMLIIAMGLVALVISVAAIATGPSDPDRPEYDLPDPDDPLAGTTPTESDNETFQNPFVNDKAFGSVSIVDHSGGTVTFRAEPNEGYQLQQWVDGSGNILGTDLTLTVVMADVDSITAVFDASYNNKVVELHWQCPVFTDDGIGGYTDEAFAIAISGQEYLASMDDGKKVRNATTSVRTPVSLLGDDRVITSITDYLEGFTADMPDLKRAIVIMTFVQDTIAYTSDSENYGTVEFWATPMETVYSGKGDCEDTATLFVNIASRMGLDVGFVAFDYADNGHMSAAVRLTNGASVSGGTTFQMDGSTYAYVETASDVHVPLGYLSPVYKIEDGKFTPITYADGAYTEGTTKTIGIQTPVEAGSGVNYGTISNPPVLEMRVGDSFSYTAETNMESVITAEGPGLEFLTFDEDTDTLHGTATRVGTFNVVLTAVWSKEGLSQTAYQVITFHVSEPVEGDPVEYTYADGVWTADLSEEDAEDVPSEDGPVGSKTLIIGLALIVIVGVLAVRRIL